MTNLIAISGPMGSGKDLVARIIREIDPEWEIKKYAGKLKQVASLLTGIAPQDFDNAEVKRQFLPEIWDRVHKNFTFVDGFTTPVSEWKTRMTVRDLLQRLGTDAVRHQLHPNTWVNALFADYTPESRWLITDCRFPNEAEAVKQRGGLVLRVNRWDLLRLGYEDFNPHVSETALDDWAFDHVIENNDGMEELKERVTEFYNQTFNPSNTTHEKITVDSDDVPIVHP